MAKRTWKVKFRARPQPDGLERLGQAVRLAIDREVLDREPRGKNYNAAPKLGTHASVDAIEELDA